MARSRLKHGKACNIAKSRGIHPSNVYQGLTRGNTHNEVLITIKSQYDNYLRTIELKERLVKKWHEK